MRKSKVRGKAFNAEDWVVSVINGGGGTKGKLFGHAVLLIEGVKVKDHLSLITREEIFVGQYDIKFEPDDLASDSSIANVKGRVSKVRVYGNESSKEEEVYT